MTISRGLAAWVCGLGVFSIQFACRDRALTEAGEVRGLPDASELVESETEQNGDGGRVQDADASVAVDQTTFCGVDLVEEVVAILCPREIAGCLYEVGCCVQAGFEVAQEDCEELRRTECRTTVLSNLQAGACFDLAAYQTNLSTPGCDKNLLELRDDCLFPLLQTILANNSCVPRWINGNIPAGGTCSESAQCAVSGEDGVSVCPVVNAVGPTSDCRPVVILEAGDSCGEPNITYRCPPGHTCIGELGEGRCQPQLVLGEACEGSFDCASYACYDGICTDPSEVSSAPCVRGGCAAGFTCESDLCVRSLLHVPRGGCDLTL